MDGWMSDECNDVVHDRATIVTMPEELSFAEQSRKKDVSATTPKFKSSTAGEAVDNGCPLPRRQWWM